MNEAVIKRKLAELGGAVAKSPKTDSGKAGEEGFFIGSPQAKSTVEESIEVLSLQIKYMLFDLEATRRENKYLRQMLDSRPKGGEGTDGESKGW